MAQITLKDGRVVATGNHITWTSNGVEKTGRVVFVIPAGITPSNVYIAKQLGFAGVEDLKEWYTLRFDNAQSRLLEDGILVEVSAKDGQKPMLYRPRVDTDNLIEIKTTHYG